MLLPFMNHLNSFTLPHKQYHCEEELVDLVQEQYWLDHDKNTAMRVEHICVTSFESNPSSCPNSMAYLSNHRWAVVYVSKMQ